VANVRINAHPSPLRRVAVAMALLLAFFSIFLLGQKMFVCNHQSTWGHTPHRRPYCDLGLVVAIPSVSSKCHINRVLLSIVTWSLVAFVADLLLVFVPIKMFWNVKLNKNLRRLIIVLFSASILTTLASIPQAAIQIWVGGPLSSLTSEIEVSLCHFLLS
jgi:hypothetical protein